MPEEIIGRRIIYVRLMTQEELQMEAWDHLSPLSAPLALVLDSGVVLYAARDAEGNGPGALFGTRPDGKTFRLQMKPKGEG